MGIGGSIKLFRIFGIRVGVDFSWFVVLFLAIFWLSGVFKSVLGGSDTTAYLAAVATALLFFASLLLHELGHALIARRAGIGVPRIDLWMLGGLARMDREASSPGEEFKISVAGPLVSLTLAVVCFGASALLEGNTAAVNAVTLTGDVPVSPLFLMFTFLATMNAVIFFFNLLPAWPLDGGRIARSIAWKLTGSKIRATVISANLGKGLAVLLGAVGGWQVLNGDLGGLWWLMLAFFIGSAARSAVFQTKVQETIGGRSVVDIMDRHPVTLPIDVDVVRADEEWFRRYGWSWFPVVDSEGRFVGIANEEPVRTAAERPGLGAPPLVGDVMDATAADEWRVLETEPLEALMASQPLARHGALMAVDENGVLRGVVTVDQVRRAVELSGL